MDYLRIHGLELNCIVGVRPHERSREQPIRLDVELALHTLEAGRSGRIAHTVDYDLVANQLAAMLRFRRYRLLEVAGEELATTLIACHPHVRVVRLRIEKPQAFPKTARAASLEVVRRRTNFAPVVSSNDLGQRTQWLATRDTTLSLLGIDPGASVTHAHAPALRCLTWAVVGQLTAAGTPPLNALPRACQGIDTTWSNASSEPAVIFECLARGPEPAEAS